MLSASDLCDLIHKGGVVTLEGQTMKAVYSDMLSKIHLPSELDQREVFEELLLREKILSTAVGDGVAIPHPRKPMLSDESEQRMAVCFLKEPLDMKALDTMKVRVLFVPIMASSPCHLELLSCIALLVRNVEFKKLLWTQPDENTLCDCIKKILQ